MKYIKLWLTLALLGSVSLLQAAQQTEIVDIEKLQKHKDDMQTHTNKKHTPTRVTTSHQSKKQLTKEVPHVKKHQKVTRVAHTTKKIHRKKPSRYIKMKHHPKRYDNRSHQRCRMDRPRHVRAYRVPQKRWRRAYINRHAPFYDRFGYFYGYFDQEGFMFEGRFRPYTRHYSYRDRVRGRSLFERRYYKPLFCRAGR